MEGLRRIPVLVEGRFQRRPFHFVLTIGLPVGQVSKREENPAARGIDQNCLICRDLASKLGVETAQPLLEARQTRWKHPRRDLLDQQLEKVFVIHQAGWYCWRSASGRSGNPSCRRASR